MKKKNRANSYILFGILLLVCAFSLTAYNFRQAQQAETSAFSVATALEAAIPAPEPTVFDPEQPDSDPQEQEIPDYQLDPARPMPTQTISGRTYIGVLKIEALSLELPVQSQWSYPNLKVSPCCYQGSAYQDDFIILAHNFWRHFGQIKNLNAGDIITFTDVDGNVFTYAVSSLETLRPTAVEEMTTGDDWDLTLFTCTVGGRSRVTLRCTRVTDDQ